MALGHFVLFLFHFVVFSNLFCVSVSCVSVCLISIDLSSSSLIFSWTVSSLWMSLPLAFSSSINSLEMDEVVAVRGWP